MTKKAFVTLILGAVGALLFALGMCMALLQEWDAFTEGVALGAAGIVVLLVLLLVRRKMSGKPMLVWNGRAVALTALGVAGALILGVGMCMTMAWDMLVPGVIVGIVGIVALLGLIPAVKGLK